MLHVPIGLQITRPSLLPGKARSLGRWTRDFASSGIHGIAELWTRWRRQKQAERISQKYRNFTMVGHARYVDNLMLACDVESLPGCIVECGAWRGGINAGLVEILGRERHYYLLDSFEGLPPASELDGPKAKRWQSNTGGATYYDNCSAEIAYAQRAIASAGAAHVDFIKGWFHATLPAFAPDEPIALLRLDGDWYESTLMCLEALYPHLTRHGLVIIDDYYHWDGCARAVHDYLSQHKVPDRIRQTPKGTCYILKEGARE